MVAALKIKFHNFICLHICKFLLMKVFLVGQNFFFWSSLISFTAKNVFHLQVGYVLVELALSPPSLAFEPLPFGLALLELAVVVLYHVGGVELAHCHVIVCNKKIFEFTQNSPHQVVRQVFELKQKCWQ